MRSPYRLRARCPRAALALLAILPVAALATLAAPLSAQPTASTARTAPRGATLFRNVRVFDGTRALPAQDVLVQDGRIAKLGRGLAAPAGATVVDGAGRTLLPGLVDAHVHAYGDVGRAALAFGVTTELDMFSDVATLAAARARQAAGPVVDRADLHSAGTLVTAPGGHGTEYGVRIPTIASPDSARAFVDARLAEGSEWIKLVYDDGRAYGMTFGSIDAPTMRAVIDAAHARGKLAVVHPGSVDGARAAIDAGADGLVHLAVDRAPDADFGARIAARRAFVIPTLTVLASITGTGGGAPLARDPRVVPYLSRTDSTTLLQGFPQRPGTTSRYAHAVAALRQLRAAGVPILAGTDAGNPGTSHGAALHRELELLVEAGLTPAEALAAATSVPARAFKLADRGRIAPGLRADLVLVHGDPTTDVTATRAIDGVWKHGVRVDRAAWAAEMAATRTAVAAVPSGSDAGLVSDFDADPVGGMPNAVFGAGWMQTDDTMAGGKSTTALRVVDGGANGSARALEITGTISPAFQAAWAGAMFSPGAQPFAAADLSAKRELRFHARGDGRTYRVMLFAEHRGRTPLVRSFVAGPEWQEHVFPLSAFGGIDGRDVQAIIVTGGPAEGAFRLRIDEVRLR